MINLTINGQRIAAEEGSTILEAAKKLHIKNSNLMLPSRSSGEGQLPHLCSRGQRTENIGSGLRLSGQRRHGSGNSFPSGTKSSEKYPGVDIISSPSGLFEVFSLRYL